MSNPDKERAIAYARERLERELSPALCYHDLSHTFDEVLPAALLLAEKHNLGEEETGLVAVAAAFHDIGWIQEEEPHEEFGARIVHNMLPGFGFSPQQVERIAGMILAKRVPQSPHNLLEEILVDADMAVLGGEEFWRRSEHLRVESGIKDDLASLREWLSRQLDFLETHQYCTAAASDLCGIQKEKNSAALRERLAELDVDGLS